MNIDLNYCNNRFTNLIASANQIKAALRAIRSVDDLPMFLMPDGKERIAIDILEWLSLRFGFQVEPSTHFTPSKTSLQLFHMYQQKCVYHYIYKSTDIYFFVF